jgi:hypothetical protein
MDRNEIPHDPLVLDFHQVRSRKFLSLWCVWHKPHTHLASRLALSPDGLKQASTRASSPGVSSDASKMIYELMVYLVQTVHLYFTNTNTISKRTKTRFHMTHSFRTSIGCVQDDFRAYGTFFTNRGPILRQD